MRSGGWRRSADITGSPRRVPDDAYVVMPNQLGIDYFDLEDAFGCSRKNFMCSADLSRIYRRKIIWIFLWTADFNPRDAFGSHDDSDHVYNTPRAWYMERYLNPNICQVGWTGCRLLHRFQMISHGAWYRRKRSRWRMSNMCFLRISRGHLMILMQPTATNP